MREEYAVNIYNKYHDRFEEQIDVFSTYEEAVEFIKKGKFDLDKDSEYVEIVEIEYDDDENETGIHKFEFSDNVGPATKIVLSFRLKGGLYCKDGRFEAENLKVTDEGIEYSDLKFFRDGERYDRDIETWAGHKLYDSDILAQVINAYLRKDKGYEFFSDEWEEILRPLIAKKTDTLLPAYRYNGLELYELELKTDHASFYRHEDEYLVLDDKNQVLTDICEFFMAALEEALNGIATGAFTCLYAKDEVKAYAAELV